MHYNDAGVDADDNADADDITDDNSDETAHADRWMMLVLMLMIMLMMLTGEWWPDITRRRNIASVVNACGPVGPKTACNYEILGTGNFPGAYRR